MESRRILCVVHCFYPEFVRELADCVANVADPHDVVVTYSAPAALEEARRRFPDARFVECENVGFDVWPFLKVVNETDLSSYSHVLKLHTKCDRPADVPFRMNHADFSGSRWREYLLDFVRTRADWEASLARMESDPDVNMVAGLKCILRREDTPWRPEQAGFDAALEMAAGLGIRPRSPEFVAGTMFVARASALAKVRGVFAAEDFSEARVHTTTTRGHYLERILGFAACDGDGRISDPHGRLASWRRRGRVVGALVCAGRFFFQRKRTADGGEIVKVLKLPVFRRAGAWRSGRADSSGCVFVTVVRDREMYDRLVRNNPNNAGAEFVAFDNLAENLPVTRRYNSFLEGWDYSRPAWFVFLHEDYEFLEPLGACLDRVDRRCIYGTVGARSTRPGDDALWALNSNRDGSELGLYGSPISAPVPVLTADCNCLIVHSDLVRDYSLRFDENLTFDLYAEDFEMNAFERFGVRTKVLGVRNHHYSFGHMAKRFFEQRRYLMRKYSDASRAYGTTTKQIIGPMPLVLAARRANRRWRRRSWLRKIARFLWYRKYSRDGYMRLRLLGLRFRRKVDYCPCRARP